MLEIVISLAGAMLLTYTEPEPQFALIQNEELRYTKAGSDSEEAAQKQQLSCPL